MIQAVIFDMDGVISDTQKFHALVESELLQKYGITLSPNEITKRYAGVNDEKMFGELFAQYNIHNVSIKDTINKKWDLMAKIVHEKVDPIPHATQLIENLKKNNFKLAVASASTKKFIKTVLESLDVAKYFDVVVSAEEVQHGKPAPDIFLLAAKKLDVDPSNVIVIEDGESGMQAASAAGMKCIGLVSNREAIYPATITVESLEEITVDKINTL